MWSKIKHYITPVFEDEDKTRTANLLFFIILTLLLISVVRTILSFWAVPQYLGILVKANLVMAGVFAIVFILMRLDRIHLACILFTLYQWLSVAWLTYHYGGINLSVYSFFFFVILAAGLLLGGTWAIRYTIISIIFGLLLLYLENQGSITPVIESPLVAFSTMTPSFITTAILVYLYHRDMTRSLTQSREHAARSVKANEQVTREISARKNTEKQLLRAQKMEAVGTLAGGIAHDFNNSLQGILGYVQILLLDKKEENPEFAMLEQIESTVLKASELTQQLLTFSRKLDSKLEPKNLNEEIQQFEKLLSRTIPKMIHIELSLKEDLNMINADSTQIEQVMMNICINARDAMPKGGEIIIATENVVLNVEYCKSHLGVIPGNYVLLRISDNGTGIDKDTLDHIFEPFYTSKEDGKGTGLGLAMVYGIVQNHKGHIICESESGEGTVFNIYFPVIKEDYVKEQKRVDKKEIEGGNETILLVDDDDNIREFTKDLLLRFGYNVLSAVDGENAVKLYKEGNGRIPLVILDLIMPGMGGQKCLEEIRKIDPLQKVVIASGYSINSSETEKIKNDYCAHLEKPYKMEQMLAVVRDVLDQK